MARNSQQLQATLRVLKEHDPVRVAFVIDEGGGLVAWVGRSDAFSPMGQFTPFDANAERDENLYLTVLGDHFLGILFTDGAPFEEIQGYVDEHSDTLREHLGYDD